MKNQHAVKKSTLKKKHKKFKTNQKAPKKYSF